MVFIILQFRSKKEANLLRGISKPSMQQLRGKQVILKDLLV